jgi:oxaloacetate decarboxylase beta subunit
MLESIQTFLDGITFFSLDATQQLQMVGMWLIAAILLWLGVAKQFEPLLLVPIAFGALIANIPDNGMLITKVNKQIISVDEQGKMTETSFTDVGFLRINLAPLKTEIAPSEASKFASVEEQQKYDAAMASPMVATPVEKDGKIVAGKYDLKGQQGQNYVVTSISGGLYDWLGLGVKAEIFPPIIFLGVGALTDFGPLLAAPRTLLLGAAAQVGVAATFFMAMFLGFSKGEAASIGIIGGADGPTSIFLTMKLAPHLLGAVAVAAYTYMALVPLIQPPIMKLLTTKEQRKIKMKKLRDVSKGEKLFFAVLVTIVTILLIPDASPLLGMLMLGNFMRECGVTERLVKAAQNEITNIMTIFLGTAVGLTMQGERFLQTETIMIICLGIVAFGVATAGGLITAQIMNLIWRKNPVNPLIGSAGVSAVPMAARVSHNVGQKSDPTNYLLMHAMGPNVAGVIGTAVIAGYYIATLAH